MEKKASMVTCTAQYRVTICAKTSRQELPFFRKACSKPIFELFAVLQCKHNARTAIFAVPIGGATACRHNVFWCVIPQKQLQIHDVDTCDRLFHVERGGNVFVNYENVVTQFLFECTLSCQCMLTTLA